VDDQLDLRRLIGLADSCELQAAAWVFPDEQIAAALVDGTFAADAHACLADAGAEPAVLEAVDQAFAALELADVASVRATMRLEHSRLFLVTDERPSIYPFEGPFLYTASNDEGMPALFGTRTVHAIKDCMRAAGVLPVDSNTEPVDSAWNEFTFLSYLYGSLAQAQAQSLEAAPAQGQAPCAAAWREHIRTFYDQHAQVWLPAFMDRVCDQVKALGLGGIYAAFALLGKEVLARIEADVRLSSH